MPLAAIATVALAAGTVSATEIVDPSRPDNADALCYRHVPAFEGQCLAVCAGLAPTVGVPPGGADFYAPSGRK